MQIRFSRHAGCYNPGELATFPEAQAQAFIDNGDATPMVVESQGPGEDAPEAATSSDEGAGEGGGEA